MLVISPASSWPRLIMMVAKDIPERKRTEEALRKSEERWRSVFENSAIGVALTDLNGRFLAANSVYQKMLGYGEEELRTLSFVDITHEDDREANWELATELLEGKRQQFQIEKRYRRKDGNLVWVRNNVSLVPGTETMPRFIMALSEDITERKRAEEGLHHSEERVRLILDSAAEGIFGCDPEGTCLFCNPAAVRLLGYDDPSELLGKNMHALEHHTRADGSPYPIEECPIYVGFLKNEGVHRDDEIYWRKDGTSFPVEFWSHPIVRDGKTLGAVVTFVDITERKQAEEALRKSEERKRSLLEINNAIVTNLTKDALHHAICEALRSVLTVDRASLTLYQPDRGTLRIIALERDWHLDFFGVGTEMNRKDSHHGWVFDNQRPLLRRDLETEWQYPIEQRLLGTGLRSFCIAPLILEGRSIGTLGIGSDKANQYSELDAEFLCEVAGQVALAAANMKSYEEIATLNTKVVRTAGRLRTILEVNNAIITNLTEEALLRSISDAVRPLIHFDRCAITLYKPETDTLRFMAVEGALRSDYFQAGLEVGRTETSAGWVFDHQQPLLRRNLEEEQQFANERRLCAEGLGSLCVVPLILQGKSIGTLSVVSQKKDQYSEADVQLLQEVAIQVALAIENMKSYEEIATLNTKVVRTADQLRTLLEINNAIITNLSEEALLRSIAEALRPVVSFDRAAFTFYLAEKNVFRFTAIEGGFVSDYFRPGLEIEPAGNSVGWVFHHQRPIIRGDLEKEQQYANERRLAAEGVRSHCMVPLIVRGKSIGTLNVASGDKNRYSEADAQFLQEVANQVALAIANMKSYEEIAALKARLEKENIYLQEEIRTEHNFEEIVGNSPALLAVLRKVEQVAPTDSTVLINGETGTGKELIARAIHNRSARKDRALVRVNCSAISAGLVESELFGHLKGAFTGAIERRSGRFELADGGTIFLDEIGELPLDTQVKLLRVLQEHEFEPVGSSRPLRVDVRVIAATNRNLEESIRAGRFRSDLFYRLNVFPLEMPPLRERRSDIPQLVAFYVLRYSKRFGKKVEGVSQESMDRLLSYPWPGNVRELQNVVERAIVLSTGPTLRLDKDLVPVTPPGKLEVPEIIAHEARPAGLTSSRLPTLEEMERSHILAALQQAAGVVEGPKGAARLLNLHPNTLRHRMSKFGIKRSDHRPS
ncbi:MAG TPA: sigma 54-interacting transcriptional regulator [Terriglobia bacterium]|nr:sigma 54-interacting transcriptional regulator [Terriglobia bacterium]